MKRLLAVLAASASLFVGAVGTSHAAFTPTDETFLEITQPSWLKFTFFGKSAADTSVMRMAFNGQTIFMNTSAIGTSTIVGGPLPVAGSPYLLELENMSVPAVWSSNPALNPDGATHLAFTTDFSNFNLGAVPLPVPEGTIFYGWEDRAFPRADADYNDLVFTVDIITNPSEVPEPSTYALMLAGLAMFGLMARRRMG